MIELFESWFSAMEIGAESINFLAHSLALLIILILAVIANYITKRYLISLLNKIVNRTKFEWDDILVKRRVFTNLAHLAPAIVVYLLTPLALAGSEDITAIVLSIAQIYMIAVVILVIDALLNSVLDIYQAKQYSREIPIKGFVQVAKIIIYFLGFIFIISILLNKTPWYLLSGLGALTAVLMLIFRDAILGFVAGIQLAANKMVAEGDWIEMPKYGADGEVLEVALTTVKVRNWDKTITTIPTAALISDSFKNWRGMQESGGRRIKRSIFLDMTSVTFCDEEMLDRFSRIRYISQYIADKKKELQDHNLKLQVENSSDINGRRLTNIGTFRAYVSHYLKNHPMISQNMTFLVRHLDPTPEGLPLEIYVFSKDIVWANYESIQADIFDHILAILPQFDLRVFQNPTGGDFQKLLQKPS